MFPLCFLRGEREGCAVTLSCDASVVGLSCELERRTQASRAAAAPGALNGVWNLAYCSEPGLYRSSPFFWGFSQLLGDKSAACSVEGFSRGSRALARVCGSSFALFAECDPSSRIQAPACE